MPESKIRITKDSPITFVELPATSGGRLDGGSVSDIYSRLKQPPRAIPILHSGQIQAGYKDVVSIAPQYTGLKLTNDDWRRISGTAVLELSFITRTQPQTAELARKYKELKPDGLVIAGGVHATALPEECLEWADIVVRGEGEETQRELMFALKENGSAKGVKGVSYREGDGIVHEPDRELLSEKQLAELSEPIYSETVRKGMRMNSIFTSRGCTGGCNFCFVPIIYGDCYRRKPNEVIIRQLKALPSGITFIIDDYFMGKPKHTKDLLVMMKEEGLNTNTYLVQLRAQAGLIPNAPQLLREAGVRMAAVGFESQSDETLKLIGKTTTAAQNREGARALRDEDIRIHGMFMLGLDGDTKESVRETVEFAKEECDTAQFFAPGPVFGTEFASMMDAQGRILTRDYFLYDGQNVIVRPKNFSPIEHQWMIINATNEFYSYGLMLKKAARTVFGWTGGKNGVSTYRNRRDFVYDLMIRNYAREASRSFVSDPQTIKAMDFLKSVS